MVAVAVPAVMVAIVGVEIVLALSREYEPTTPPLPIGGDFGPPDGTPLTFAVLGDSTAAGVGAGMPSRAYPELLAERLGSSGRRVHLVALGVSGARTRDVLVSQLPQALEAGPDLVFIGIGANDATHLTSVTEVEADMRAILGRLRESGATVVVAGAPDMRVAAFLEPLRSIVAWRGRAVSSAIEAAAAASSVPFVPLAERTGHFFAEDPGRFYSDDLFHPGPAGYALWADAIAPYLLEALASA